MNKLSSMANYVLIAMPTLANQGFEHAVIYVCEHQKDGAVGLIINRPLIYPLGVVFDQLEIEPICLDKKKLPLLYGGPIQPERGFVIHKQTGHWHSSMSLNNDVTVTTSNDIIHAIAGNTGPQDMLVTLGYTGWGEQQLEQEILDNLWLVCPFKPELLYEVPFEERWEYAGSLIGIKPSELTLFAGHA